MIYTLEELMERASGNAPMLAIGALPEEYFLADAAGSESSLVAPALVERLMSLGIFYVYGGTLELNAMAMRILEDMREGGVPLEEQAFHFRVEESKRLYHDSHPEFWPEAGMDFQD